MHIALFVATQRGHLVLQHIHQMFPTIQTTVFSFKEEPWEPPFLENIHHETLAHKGQFFETKNIASSRLKPFWQNTEIDLILAIGWRYMIPSEICERARLGTYIIHDSLLPTYRGFSPTVWSIINVETVTGATLFAAVPEVDAGDIVAQIQVPIGDDDPISTVMERVTQAYLVLVDNNLPSLLNGTAQLTAQDHSN